MLVALIAAVLVLPGAPVGAQGGASATLEDQASGGATVTVAQATLPDGGFLAIHDATLQDGQVLKSVRGASSFLPAGSHEDITVHLDQPLTEDTTLIAMPHKDTDDDRIYSFVSSGGTVDGPYTSGGDIVVDAAEVKASAIITFEEQPTDGDSILISSVEMIDGGFIAVHDSSLLDGAVLESVIGVSPFLAPGQHKDVRVELDDTVTSDDTLIPMPHKDTNDNEVYDFITSEGADDGPYTDHDGEIVVAPAEVTTAQPASVTFRSQPTGGTLVDVEEVYLPEGGFVTIHDSTLTEMAVIASVRGSSDYLEPGLHKHVVLELNDPFSLGDNAIAMPHQDTDDDESYDFVTSGGTEDGPYTEDGEAVTDDGVLTISASVHAHDQASNGRTLQIAYADLSEGGFIAVHDPSLLAGDVIPSVVGHSEFLEAGEHRDLTLQLDPGVNETQILLPMPHRDTDGDETYDFVTSQGADDGPYVDGEGNPVVDTAHVAVTAWVDFRDQSTDGATITVDAVTMHDGGFVAIHDSSLLDGEVIPSVIGVSDFLAPGTHTDIQVSLDPALDTGETLFAMPHLDTNGNEAYDFIITEGSEDGPYTSDDGPVLQAGQATVTDDDGGDGGDDDAGGADGGDGNDGGDGDSAGDGDDGMEEAPGPGLLVALGVLAAIAALRRRRA